MNPELIKGTFRVDTIDPDGRVYMRVSRAVCTSDDGSVTLITDFNREEYQLLQGDRITVCLASTLDREGHKGDPVYDHSLYHRDSLLSDYEYAMHGRVYECAPLCHRRGRAGQLRGASDEGVGSPQHPPRAPAGHRRVPAD